MKQELALAVPLWIAPLVAGGDTLLQSTVYDAALECDGGEVRFGIRLERGVTGRVDAFVMNGEEVIPVPTAGVGKGGIGLAFDYYDSTIMARFDAEGGLSGQWKKRRSADEWTTMKFRATPGGLRTMDFQIMPEWISGRWRVKFADEADEAVAVFGGGDRRDLRGTFLTTTGDYRFLAGIADKDALSLSCFDGSHAFLFKAALQPDGTLKGDFWSGPTFHDTWTAVKDDNAALPDPFGLTKFTGTAAELDALAFPDASGTTKKLADFPAKARIIELFGTWCPNCLDATRVLADLDKTYRHKGLSIVGLAFEVTGDAERDRKQVALYAERHNVTYPLLIAGKKDKAEASAKFPVIDKLRAYPTFIFIDASGKVRGVYTGFSGPATGEEHERLKRALEEKVLDMLED
jgi:thiol-disulfide isomerase/thioredoxin